MTHHRRRRLPLLLIALGCCALLNSCAGGPDPAFTAASRAAFGAIAPEYLQYVDGDLRLSQEQKDRRRTTVALWDEAIKVREAEVAK